MTYLSSYANYQLKKMSKQWQKRRMSIKLKCYQTINQACTFSFTCSTPMPISFYFVRLITTLQYFPSLDCILVQ
ncbi:hypothetical protein FGO68_gene13654 [Halteria grandinella]|uniref:Uncharacterized protein n=1 Tax=Halteria grandinella TaxID=5974 RepID=A0A8J8T183_HALGN|nr:hypothetical protein FGO68_gene13654 [Halteria grandinella]